MPGHNAWDEIIYPFPSFNDAILDFYHPQSKSMMNTAAHYKADLNSDFWFNVQKLLKQVECSHITDIDSIYFSIISIGDK